MKLFVSPLKGSKKIADCGSVNAQLANGDLNALLQEYDDPEGPEESEKRPVDAVDDWNGYEAILLFGPLTVDDRFDLFTPDQCEMITAKLNEVLSKCPPVVNQFKKVMI